MVSSAVVDILIRNYNGEHISRACQLVVPASIREGATIAPRKERVLHSKKTKGQSQDEPSEEEDGMEMEEDGAGSDQEESEGHSEEDSD